MVELISEPPVSDDDTAPNQRTDIASLSSTTETPSPSLSHFDVPVKNLILTGFLGVGKSSIALEIVKTLQVNFLDVDEEIETRELMSIPKIRELYGDSRLKALEHSLCRQAALMRRSVIVVPGAALIDKRNFDLLTEVGKVVVLTCELGEALRRLHLQSYINFRDPVTRGRMLGRIRREHDVVNDIRLLQLDTTHLAVTEAARLLMRLWITGETEGGPFRYGPPPPIKPPPKTTVGLSSRIR